MAELYVILGATGHVGGLAAARLLEAGKRVRAVARHADKLAPLAKRGAEAAAGSIDDPAFLRKALEGARAAFLLLPPNLAPGIRAWQDRTAKALGDAIEAARVSYVVTLSSVGAQAASGNGPIAGLHALEQRLDRVPGLSPLHLRPGFFFENHHASIGMIRAMGMTGGAIRPDLKIPQVATRDIGEFAARRLRALDWKGRAIQELHGERLLTMAEAATALGKAIGRPDLRYAQFPYAEALKGMVQMGLPEEMAALYVEMAQGFNEGRIAMTQPPSAETTTPTSVEKWAGEVFAPAFQAAG
jgi:uncharacterized protein YbjT (DUF2867 family)